MKVAKQLTLTVFIILILTQIVWAEIGYITNSDDTLENVAEKFNVTVEDIRSANDLTEDSVIHEGMRLVIPYSSEEGFESDQIETNNATEQAEIVEYVVVRGDCLERIARDHQCDLNELLEINDLERTTILEIGRRIKIPPVDNIVEKSVEEPAVSEIDSEQSDEESDNKPRFKKNVFVGVKADNISGKNLLDLSQLDGAEIVIIDPNVKSKTDVDKPKTPEKEDVVKISVIKKNVKLPSKSTSDISAIKGYIEHKIVRRDSVSKLSHKYGVSESSIYKLNGISKRDVLRIGRKIKIPVGSTSVAIRENIQKDDGLITRKLAKRDKLVNKALKYKGLKYRYGGTNLNKGVDCSGLTMKIYESFGVKLPHSSRAQSRMGKKVEKNNLLPGDIVFFSTKNKGVTHCGIYIGEDQILHASTSKRRVQVDKLSSPYFANRYYTARRYL